MALWDPWLLSAAAPPAPFFQSLFKADPHSQTEANKEERLFCSITRYKLKASGVTYITSLPCRTRSTRVSGGHGDIYAWLQLLGGYSITFVSFCGITGCGSASLKLCVCNAASHWSQNPSTDSQGWSQCDSSIDLYFSSSFSKCCIHGTADIFNMFVWALITWKVSVFLLCWFLFLFFFGTYEYFHWLGPMSCFPGWGCCARPQRINIRLMYVMNMLFKSFIFFLNLAEV